MTTGFVNGPTGLWIEKSPDADLSYTFDFKDLEDPWLQGTDTLLAATFDVPTGLVRVQEAHTGTTATVRLSGGTTSEDYKVKLSWACNAGTDSRTFTVRVRERSA